VEFICDSSIEEENSLDVLDLIELGRDLWWPDDLLALGGTHPTFPTTLSSNHTQVESSVSVTETYIFSSSNDNFEKLKHLPQTKPSRKQSGYNRINEISDQFYKPREQDVYLLDKNAAMLDHSSPAYLETNTKTSTEKSTTTRPRKRRKKPRKPFTSWLEFRDEEYQMDEYEDEEDDAQQRSKRSISIRRNKRHERRSKRLDMLRKKREASEKTIADKKPDKKYFKIWRTIKNRFGKEPSSESNKIKAIKELTAETPRRRAKQGSERKQARRRKQGGKKKSKKLRGKKKGQLTETQNMTKMERIMLERKSNEGRMKRSISDDSSKRVFVNVQWIVKCACDKACALATTPPSDLTAVGEILLRRVHRTTPP